jgi:hypothetical protein
LAFFVYFSNITTPITAPNDVTKKEANIILKSILVLLAAFAERIAKNINKIKKKAIVSQ